MILICFDLISLQDKKATLIIHEFVDNIMKALMDGLGLETPHFNPKIYLGTVTLFSKRKCEELDSVENTGNEDLKHTLITTKKPKLELKSISEQDVKTKVESNSNMDTSTGVESDTTTERNIFSSLKVDSCSRESSSKVDISVDVNVEADITEKNVFNSLEVDTIA